MAAVAAQVLPDAAVSPAELIAATQAVAEKGQQAVSRAAAAETAEQHPVNTMRDPCRNWLLLAGATIARGVLGMYLCWMCQG